MGTARQGMSLQLWLPSLAAQVVIKLVTDEAPDRRDTATSLPGVTVVSAPAEIDLANVAELREALYSAATGQAIVVVDMSGTQFCDSSGVAALVGAFKRTRADGGGLRLVLGADSVRKIFKVTGVDRFLEMYESVPAALAGGHQPGVPS